MKYPFKNAPDSQIFLVTLILWFGESFSILRYGNVVSASTVIYPILSLIPDAEAAMIWKLLFNNFLSF